MLRNSYFIIFVMGIGFFFGIQPVFADNVEVIITPISESLECAESKEGCFILDETSSDIERIVIFFNNETLANSIKTDSSSSKNDLFLENFFYPLMLLLTGGGLTGVLIPWYTNRQKTKQSELDRLRESAEKAKELERLKNEKTLEQLREDREKKIERDRQDYQFKIQLKKELIESYHIAKNSTMSELKTFHIQLFNHFATESIKWSGDSRRAILKIPDKKGKYPKQIFGEIWKELEKNVHLAIDANGNLFVLKLSWYSQSADLLEEFGNIKSGLSTYSILLNNLVKGKNKDQFQKDIHDAYKIYQKLEKDYETFRKKIVNLQIGTVPV